MITIARLEEFFFNEELIRVIFRAPKELEVEDWGFKNSFGDDAYLSQFTDRIDRQYPDLQYVVISGSGNISLASKTRLGVIRNSYV